MEALLERWGRIVARWPLIIIAAWIVLLIMAFHFGPSFSAVAANQKVSSLPASAPSMRAAQLYNTKFAAGQQSATHESGFIVISDTHGISASDVALTQQIESWLTAPATRPAHLLSVTGPGAHVPAAAFESRDHKALQVLLTWDTTNDNALQDPASKVQSYLSRLALPSGVMVGLGGSAPINYDFNHLIFGSTGLGALIGLLIILIVLGSVYRSPLAVLMPLATIGFAILLSIPTIAWFGQTFGIAVASFSLEYVAFVLLGAGTNYAVFMLSRYREEIRRGTGNDRAARHEALGRALGHVGEAIASSAATVIAATAIMGLAQLDLLRVIGPAVAVGIGCLLLAGLTLLPALMALCGRALFWPVQPRAGTLSEANLPTRGLWAGAGRLVTTYPRIVAIVTLLILAPLAISAAMVVPSFDDLRALPSTAPSVQAFTTYQQHFDNMTQVDVLISDPGHDLRDPQYTTALASVSSALAKVQHVLGIESPAQPSGQLSPQQQAQFFATDGSAARIVLDLNVEPSSQEAIQTVDAAYMAANQTEHGTPLSGAAVLIRGQASGTHDQSVQLGADFRLVTVLVSLVIFVILALLVRSVTAPLYLLGTIALSAGTAIGLTNLVYHVILGQPLFYLVPVLAFVFLVALGEDFNILTMSRIREEVGKLGRRDGIAAAVALTGGVVSSCGLVMAASFARLASNPVIEIAESGFAILVGVLIDTFVVRPLLVPALAMLLGRWNWIWPGRRVGKAVTSAARSLAPEPLDA